MRGAGIGVQGGDADDPHDDHEPLITRSPPALNPIRMISIRSSGKGHAARPSHRIGPPVSRCRCHATRGVGADGQAPPGKDPVSPAAVPRRSIRRPGRRCDWEKVAKEAPQTIPTCVIGIHNLAALSPAPETTAAKGGRPRR